MLVEDILRDRARPRTVVFYGRVSTEHEAQVSALDNQLQWYDQLAKLNPNWNVINKYIDEGITGTSAKKRPAFTKMIEDARQHKFDLIVTREVCRFARNTVDTLTYTRNLRQHGIEVYFVNDGIWTMDGDGELRITLMATLAQDESRKISERVAAGQEISRANGVLYGSGNILGYNRVGKTYIIDKEQAETVRMIFDMYLHGDGSMKISKCLTAKGRKNSSGIVKWDCQTVLRIIANATYMGMVCYNKSHSNNYLDQKRILNTNEDTYVYKKGDFQPIVSEETWEQCNAIRKSRLKPTLVVNGKVQKQSRRSSRDIWVTKMRCKCGSSFRKDIWHRSKTTGITTYGYNCYNKANHGSAVIRRASGQNDDGYCSMKMIPEWKLQLMAKKVISSVFKEKRKTIEATIKLIREHYISDIQTNKNNSLEYLQSQKEKYESKRLNILNMRAEGEINKDECNSMKATVEKEIAKIDEQLRNFESQQELEVDISDYMSGIESTLKSVLNFRSENIDNSLIDKVIESIEVVNENTFVWNVHSDVKVTRRINCNVKGRKNKAIVNLCDIDGICEDGALAPYIKSSTPELLYRLLLNRSKLNLQIPLLTYTFSYEEAEAYQKAQGLRLWKSSCQDLTIQLWVNV